MNFEFFSLRIYYELIYEHVSIKKEFIKQFWLQLDKVLLPNMNAQNVGTYA